MNAWERVDTTRLCSNDLLDVREIRGHVGRTLARWACPLDFDDLDLMVSEVATNAVRHSASGAPGGGVWVTVLLAACKARVEIQDDGGAETRPAIPERACGESGRGLMIVDALAHQWGTWSGTEGRVTVWFEVTV